MIYLAQTDTTAGFLSQSLLEINLAKGRRSDQPCLICVSKFKNLAKFTRIPTKFKNLVRRSSKTTFIYPNKQALRVVKNHPHSQFLDDIIWAYSSSANAHGKGFDIEFAKAKADVIIDEEFHQSSPSKIYKISRTKLRKIR
ncbi:threonylcarbamoyl-AMP synthase TsaC [Campylobacter iguaniorum]|uniref:hypothetical protein n=1 Tax=Campylobacter iguaniorum TaxID=1244531 RepID=UPI00073A3141|nr:hypothetical protein [Campylobacter iguaniorum]ALV23945.1 threonylcarbamoyl-AMP synthase TsaC [Campylobacter iguaniorum]